MRSILCFCILILQYTSHCYGQNKGREIVPTDSLPVREFQVISTELSDLLDSISQDNMLGKLAQDEMYLLSLSDFSNWIILDDDSTDVEIYLQISKIKKTSDFLLINNMIGFINRNDKPLFISVELYPQNFFKPTGESEVFAFIDLRQLGDSVSEREVSPKYFGIIESVDFEFVQGKFNWIGSVR